MVFKNQHLITRCAYCYTYVHFYIYSYISLYWDVWVHSNTSSFSSTLHLWLPYPTIRTLVPIILNICSNWINLPRMLSPIALTFFHPCSKQLLPCPFSGSNTWLWAATARLPLSRLPPCPAQVPVVTSGHVGTPVLCRSLVIPPRLHICPWPSQHPALNTDAGLACLQTGFGLYYLERQEHSQEKQECRKVVRKLIHSSWGYLENE